LVLFDSVGLTPPALDLLLDNGIDVTYLSHGGKIKGRILSQRGSGAVVRLAQFSAFLDSGRRLALARNIVAAKIRNQLSVVLKYKYRDTNAEFDGNIAAMTAFSKSLSKAETVDQIMGIEGVSAKYYWDCFKRLLKSQDFTRRDYRPAPDYVNALLNLGYAFLANELTTCLVAEHLDVEIGFLHSVHYGRASLALDIMEEFRAPFTDAWVLTVLNRKMLKADNFIIENGDYRLSKDGFSKFCGQYHGHAVYWRGKFRIQAQKLKLSLMDGGEYEPYPG
jgi:CRISPR-associated protein Cas1